MTNDIQHVPREVLTWTMIQGILTMLSLNVKDMHSYNLYIEAVNEAIGFASIQLPD